MKRKYSHIKKAERLEISILLNKGFSIRDIALSLKRDPGTISREISRNRRRRRRKGGTIEGSYEAEIAHHKAYVKRKYAKYQGKKIYENNELREYIEIGFGNHWSPEQISGRMNIERQPFYANKNTIYEFVYSQYGQYLCKYLPLRRYVRKKRKEKKTKRTLVPNRIGIENRPQEAILKLKYGHYEGDTIVSGKKHHSKKALSVLYEMKARYTDAKKISSLKPRKNNEAITKMSEKINVFKTLTMDNGIENTKHEELKEELGINTYFCDPYSAWQKGGVENANKLIRRFIPKGSDIGRYSDRYIRRVCDILNNTPRKSLGFKKPLEIMIENNLLKVEKEEPEKPPFGWLNMSGFIKQKIPSVALGGRM